VNDQIDDHRARSECKPIKVLLTSRTNLVHITSQLWVTHKQMEVNTNKSQWIELHTTLFGGHQSIQCPRESGTTRISESREAKLNTNPTHGLKRFCSNKSTAKSRCHKNNLDINFLGSDSNEWPTTPPQRSDTVKIDGVWFTTVPQTTDMVQGMRWHRKNRWSVIHHSVTDLAQQLLLYALRVTTTRVDAWETS
jgi:hypothetical protein